MADAAKRQRRAAEQISTPRASLLHRLPRPGTPHTAVHMHIPTPFKRLVPSAVRSTVAQENISRKLRHRNMVVEALATHLRGLVIVRHREIVLQLSTKGGVAQRESGKKVCVVVPRTAVFSRGARKQPKPRRAKTFCVLPHPTARRRAGELCGPYGTALGRARMATWVHESPSDLVTGLRVSGTAKFSVLEIAAAPSGDSTDRVMADAAAAAAVKPADVVMSEAAAAPAAKAAAAATGKKDGGGKKKGGAPAAAQAPVAKGKLAARATADW